HEIDDAVRVHALRQVREMNRFARGGVCRHRVLVKYFDQEYTKQHCGACDLCLGKTEVVDEPLLIAQKILSAVARTDQRFGTTYVAAVLRGEKTSQIVQNGHHEQSTWGLLSEHPIEEIRDWIYQLVDQNVLELTRGEYPKLQLNDKSWSVMKDGEPVVLRRTKELVVQKIAPDRQSRQVAPEARDLFDYLRGVRKNLADEKNVPAYVIFGDITLKEMAEKKPRSLDEMRPLYGIGDAKLRTVCPKFLEAISQWQTMNDER
ncbi:MAG: HRDC domain-containing protein, partial [Acidobacteria bacterium]|nr:HRDC domain-containing protein [Acidobacteriota bacterium]